MDTLAHGIGVTNRFELFYNEDVDPLEILRQQEEEKQKRKVEKTQVKDKKPVKSGKPISSSVPSKKPVETVPAKTTKTDAVEVPNKPRGGKQNDRSTRMTGNFQESKEGERNARNKDDQFFQRDPDQRDGEYRRGRGGFRGGARSRGRGYFNNAEGRPRRMFDRHSGSDKTGVRATEKREGGGPNNWGDIRSDINQRRDDSAWEEDFEGGGDRSKEETSFGNEEQGETVKFGESDEAQKSGNDSSPENADAKNADQTTDEQIQDEVKEMTLDEYKREQESKRVVPKYNIRKPGEGEDDKQWKKGYMLKKKIEESEEEEDDDEELEDEDYGRKAQQKVLLDFQFNFTDSRRGTRGRGRGGRGGPRGAGREGMNRDSPREDRLRENRGRGGGRDRDSARPKGQQAAPRVDDFNDFPSLINA